MLHVLLRLIAVTMSVLFAASRLTASTAAAAGEPDARNPATVPENIANRWAAESLAIWIAAIEERAPFARATQAEASQVSAHETHSPPAPQLTLQGIVGSRGAFSALVGGFPGHSATLLVVAGDSVGGVRIRRITSTEVVLATRDSIVRLTLRTPAP